MKQLQTLSVISPGFYGLNTQESGITLSPNFAQLTDNVIIDKYGRLGSRKGWQMRTDSGATALASEPVSFMLEHVNADNTVVTLSGGNNKLFKGGDDNGALVDITPAGYTITTNNWKGATLSDHSMLVQAGQAPLFVTAESGTLVADLATTHTAHGSHTPNYGVSYPDDDIAGAFPRFEGGSSGSLNIAAVLPHNVDTVVALAAHNGFLIIFCERNIVIYKGAEDIVNTFSLSDVIAGVGCVARDSVQNTGNDLIFLSDTGVRSLGRVIQEKSLPMRDLTKNVRDDLSKDLQQERSNIGSLKEVRSVYSEINAFYLLSFPSTETVYCLDMRQPLEDGSARVTQWYNYQATSFLRRRDREILIGKTNGIGRYFGYTDNGEAYRLRYFSHYLDLQSPTTLKILKQISVTVIGGSNQSFVIKSSFNYSTVARSYPFTLADRGVSEYGVAEYALAEFSFGVILDSIKSSVGGNGNTIQIGFEANVQGSELSVQKLDIFVKTGRTS